MYFEWSDGSVCACTCVYMYIYIIFANSENINYVFGMGNIKVTQNTLHYHPAFYYMSQFGLFTLYIILAPGL